MLVLKMAMHATVEMLMTSLSRLTLQSVTSHALVIMVNSVAAHGVCKYMIPNIHQLQLNRPMFWCWVEVNSWSSVLKVCFILQSFLEAGKRSQF